MQEPEPNDVTCSSLHYWHSPIDYNESAPARQPPAKSTCEGGIRQLAMRGNSERAPITRCATHVSRLPIAWTMQRCLRHGCALQLSTGLLRTGLIPSKSLVKQVVPVA